MDNNLLEIIKNTTEYIESNLLENLNLDDISKNVNVSKFHLLRIWKGATSTGIMEYVRRRKIAQSLSDLLNAHNTIEFISSKYSFGCERSYNRVFKDEFGITPSSWRKHPCPLNVLDHFNADFISCAGEGLVFFRSTTVLPAFTIAGQEFTVDSKDNMENQTANKLGVDFFYNVRPKIVNPVEKDVYIGFTTVIEDSDSYSLYLPSVQVNQNSIVPPGMKIKHVPPHKYGVFTYMGPHQPEELSSKTLCEIWKYIFVYWMPTIKFNRKEIFSFERVNYTKCNKKYCECDIYFPISIL